MKRSVFFIMVIVLSQSLQSQVSFTEMAKVVDVLPPSPTAAALGEYGNLPVGLSTGTPQINVPIYTLKTQNLSVPVSLNYSSNGVRVDQLSGNVGTGWVLNAGGVISRTVYGNNDEGSTWLATPGDLSTGESQQILDYLNFASEISTTGGGSNDNQPDILSYNFNGYSGKFLFDSSRNIVHITYSNLKIELQSNGYKITTPDGVAYFFGGPGGFEQSRTHSSGTCSHEFANFVPTAYYLRKILHPKGDSVVFNYNASTYAYYSGISQVYTRSYSHTPDQFCGALNACPGVIDWSTCPARLSVAGLTLREIVTSQNDKIIFKNILRTDISDSLVSKIEIYHRKDLINPFETFYLNYTYSNSGSSYTNTYTLPEFKTRPFLLHISEKNLTDSNRYYAFEYNDYNGLPPRLSFAQDEYGFFNGKNNAHLIPTASHFYQREVFMGTASAARSASSSHGAKGILKKVYYPTKGYDSLIYEGHIARQLVYTPNAPTAVNVSVVGTGNYTAGNAQTASLAFPVPQVINFAFTCSPVPGETYNVSDNYGVAKVYKGGVYLFEQILQVNQTINVSRELDFGNYVVKVTAYGKSVSCSASFGYSTGGSTNLSNVTIGGVRIASVKSYDYQAHNVNTKKYYYAVSPSTLGVSTGVVVEPTREYYEDITRINPCPPTEEHGTIPGSYRICYFMMAYAGATRNVAGGSGSHIYYSTVLEGFGDNFENGGTQNQFYAEPNESSTLIRGFKVQGAVMTNVGFRNGLQIGQASFSLNAGTMVVKKTVAYSYPLDMRVYREINGYIVRKRSNAVSHYSPPASVEFVGFDVSKYMIDIRWFPLTSTITTLYDLDGNNPVTTTVSNTYDNLVHAQPTQVRTTSSEGKNEVVVTNYPQDYATGTTYIDDMKSKNLIGYPIEQVKYREEGAAKKILAASITQYQTGGKGIKSSEMILETASPVDLTAFKFSNRAIGVLPSAGTATSFSADSKYKTRLNYNTYDAANNMQQYTFSDDVSNVLLWDYKNQYPIAKIGNATFANVAYTSFEADGKGSWTFSGATVDEITSPTGRKAYNLTAGNITKTVTSATTYIISYWRPTALSALTITGTQGSVVAGRTVNNWKYYEHKVTGVTTATITGTGLIDELRLYPSTAQMTTYVYEPSIGVTVQCDANNVISYYEYDGFGRLILITDEDKNIIRKICYNYAGQPENCLSYYNIYKTGTYTRSNCTSCLAGSSVLYTVAAGKYNSSSSQAAADQLAQDEITANGQAYANANGTCTTPATAGAISSNSSTDIVSIIFNNNCTGTNYSFNLAANSSANLGPIPKGTYKVTFSTPNSHTFFINGLSQYGSISVPFYNVSIQTAVSIQVIN